ncbi:hypothetical protein SLS60_006938 [Paraconiothyrium brasiliense]|uniref:Uncharacterized protein n=1 Tax=Paraconiothyrium brasiliense TaxID=300254 RepID=A0ABR3R9A9_9PLEO
MPKGEMLFMRLGSRKDLSTLSPSDAENIGGPNYGEKGGAYLRDVHPPTTPKLASKSNGKATEKPTTLLNPAPVLCPASDSSKVNETVVARLEPSNGEVVNKSPSTSVQQQDDTNHINRPTEKFWELANKPLIERRALLETRRLYDRCDLWQSAFRDPTFFAARSVGPLLIVGVTRLLNWLQTSLAQYRPYGLKSVGCDACSLATDIDVVLAGEALGMHAMVGKLRSYWWQWLKFTKVEDIGLDRLKALDDRISDNFVSTIAFMVIDD